MEPGKNEMENDSSKVSNRKLMLATDSDCE